MNLREISASDTIGTRLLPVAVIREQRLYLDRFCRDGPGSPFLPAYVQQVGGHYLATTPVFPALLAVPVYVVPVMLLEVDVRLVNLLSKLSGSLFAALSVAVLYLALRPLGSESGALGGALAYAFGTSTWSVSSQGLWGHGPAQLFLAAALYWAVRGEEAPRYRAGLGLAAGLMFASRPQTTGLVGLALVAHALYADRRWGLRCGVVFAGVVLAVFGYNLAAFGSIQGGYARLNVAYMPIFKVPGMWSTPLLQGLLGLLVSPSRGLLVYSPILLFAFAGILLSVRRGERPLCRFLAAGFTASLLTLSAYSFWWGGHSFGPRLLVDFLPVLAVFLAVAWPKVERRPVLQVVWMLLFAASVGVQLVGALYYPSPHAVDWNKSPVDIDLARDRLWDWSDTQLGRLLRNGPPAVGFDNWPSRVCGPWRASSVAVPESG